MVVGEMKGRVPKSVLIEDRSAFSPLGYIGLSLFCVHKVKNKVNWVGSADFHCHIFRVPL